MNNDLGAYSIELYIGEVRSGKTLSMVADTYTDLESYKKRLEQMESPAKNIMIFANFHLNTEFFKDKVSFITKDDLISYHQNALEFHKCIFLIDELQTWLDNREFMKKGNKAIGYFFGQMGKRGNVLRGTVHDYSTIDIRGRLYAQKLNYVFKGLLQPNGIWKQILNVNRLLSDDENERMYVQKTSYIKKLVKTNFLPEFKYVKLPIEYIKGKDFYEMYDTEELI